jgi:hypothetical protein
VTSRELEEYRALRATVQARGTARIWVFLAGFSAWGGLAVAGFALMTVPIETLVPLLVLVATFEAVWALHIGVERIGRYLQVFHEASGEASWESIAMTFGTPMRGTATDPLFTACFAIAAALNLLPVLFVAGAPAEIAVVGAAHLLFVARLLRARQAAGRQRAADLARFRQMKDN